jgi:predicted GNAT family acetyltransferase
VSDDAQVRDNPDRARYEIWVDGKQAGFTQYTLHSEQADFTHTEVAEEYEGQGLASQLIGDALDDARRRGWDVLPYCPFVRDYIAKHPEYRDLVPAEYQARFDLAG